jgi:hypothetical protein
MSKYYEFTSMPFLKVEWGDSIDDKEYEYTGDTAVFAN